MTNCNSFSADSPTTVGPQAMRRATVTKDVEGDKVVYDTKSGVGLSGTW